VDRIFAWYRDYEDVEGIAKVVTLGDIAANDYNLNITRYVERKNEETVLSVEEAIEQLRKSASAAFEAERKLVSVLVENGILVTEPK
jgi:type I restriction enzyme M protein